MLAHYLLLSVLAATLPAGSEARGYNEGDWLASRPQRHRLRINGQPQQTGFVCIDSAIQETTYAAAEGVRASGSDLFNVVAVQGANSQTSAYYPGDAGQGSSCNVPTTFAAQSCPSSGTMNSVPIQNTRYSFDARGIKVTCKSACGQGNAINKDNWRGLITQLSAFMRDNNAFGARFAVKRTNTNTVVARCRVTSPNIGLFTLDTCPDRIPNSGSATIAADSQPS
ncbi:Hypothetical protein D9617_31g064290 [Elsinoe fawcettii]|nr:Hypothetical protein D9617_31g064290 [Elsinoe fawcettii]